MAGDTVSLKDYFDAILTARDRHDEIVRDMTFRYEDVIHRIEQRNTDREAAWIKEKFDSHNNLLRAWQLASTEDRANFVKMATFEALRDAFAVNTTTTAKALTLAEGKSSGYHTVVAGLAFAGGMVIAFGAAWAMLHGH
jgi:hypothetical protein